MYNDKECSIFFTERDVHMIRDDIHYLNYVVIIEQLIVSSFQDRNITPK